MIQYAVVFKSADSFYFAEPELDDPVIAIVSYDPDDEEGGLISSTVGFIFDLYDNFMEAYSIGYNPTDGIIVESERNAKLKLISMVFENM